MQRYFLKNSQFQNGKVSVTDDDAHHMKRVMRMKNGDTFIGCNENKECFYVEITEIETDFVQGKIIEQINQTIEIPIEVTIAQGLPKGDKFEWVLQKGTECGAANFIPVKMERCVAKIDAKKESKKVERWTKIVKEAAEQSHRQSLPKVSSIMEFKNLLNMAKNYDACLFAYEEIAKTGEMSQLKKTINSLSPGSTLLILVGPEGGISENEEALLRESGFLPCALGPRILRTETAPIYILSAISYALEL